MFFAGRFAVKTTLGAAGADIRWAKDKVNNAKKKHLHGASFLFLNMIQMDKKTGKRKKSKGIAG